MKTKNFITVGTFDGVHTGHRFLFNRLDVLAVEQLQKPLILYFPYPPKTLLSPRPEMTVLTTPREKKALLGQTSDAKAAQLDFETCRNMSPESFFENVLLQEYNMGGLLVGKDFAFGKDRAGHTDFLRAMCARHRIPFEVSEFFTAAGHKVSSSLIRKTLAEGNIPAANALLGYPYALSGKVIVGNKLGRKLGFPTANLDTGIYKILPLGVFAVKVNVGRETYDGFCNIGFRPTVNTIQANIPLVEVHIFNFNKSIYGRTITVHFVEKLRDEKKFDGLSALIAQLTQDKQTAAKLLA